jgi:transmembrane sensor
MTQADDADAGPEGAAWEAAMRAAIDWTILLGDDREDASLRARLEAWLIEDALHREAWAEATRFDGILFKAGRTSPPLPSAAPRRPQRRRTWPRRRARPLVAAGLAASIAAISVVAGPTLLLHARADHLTGTAQEQLVRLEDGSTVRLAPKSAIRLAYASGTRRVDLLAGEAYFEVARDPARPFTVTADESRVTVLGTGFDVRRSGPELDVAVKHGRVRVASGSHAVELGAGERAHLDKAGAIATDHVAPGIVDGWNARRIVAIDRPLAQVVADLRRYHSGAILLTSDALGRRSITGTFDASDPAAVARLIVQPHGGVVRQISPWLIVISER